MDQRAPNINIEDYPQQLTVWVVDDTPMVITIISLFIQSKYSYVNLNKFNLGWKVNNKLSA